MKWHVEVGTTATSQCPIYRDGKHVGNIKPEHAKALASALMGRSKGGKARWHGMTKKARSAATSDAAKARWAKSGNRVALLNKATEIL